MKILSFDIEDWFHILDNPETKTTQSWERHPSRLRPGVERILNQLDSTKQNATFFCLGWVAERYPDVIRSIDEQGHHIATHSYAHQLVYEQSRSEFREDLRKSITILEDITGKKVDCYRAPGFSITAESMWAFDILINEGIRIDCSLFPARRAHGGVSILNSAIPSRGLLNEHQIHLFPLNTKSFLGKTLVYSGGGYFRIFPKQIIQKWFCDDEYVMTYFHPRDFDYNQPAIPGLNSVRRFKSYIGIRGALNKLQHLLERFEFTDVNTASLAIDWNNTPTVDLGTSSSS